MYIARIRKIAAETDSAHTNRVAITVAFRGAKSPKLIKIIARGSPKRVHGLSVLSW